MFSGSPEDGHLPRTESAVVLVVGEALIEVGANSQSQRRVSGTSKPVSATMMVRKGERP